MNTVGVRGNTPPAEAALERGEVASIHVAVVIQIGCNSR